MTLEGEAIDAQDARGYTPLMRACRGGAGAVALALVSKGANVHARSSIDGNTALLLACSKTDLSAVALAIIRAGASILARNKEGQSALLLACQCGASMSEAAVAIIEMGIDPTRVIAVTTTTYYGFGTKPLPQQQFLSLLSPLSRLQRPRLPWSEPREDSRSGSAAGPSCSSAPPTA